MLRSLIHLKKLIRHFEYVESMSARRADAIQSLRGLSEELKNHIIKCIVYGRNLGDYNYNHWIEEISEYISIANDITVKPSAKKLKAEIYRNELFGSFGENLKDASVLVRLFLVKEENKYAKVEVSERLYQRVYDAFQKIMDLFIPILVSNNSMTKSDFIPIVKKAIRYR